MHEYKKTRGHILTSSTDFKRLEFNSPLPSNDAATEPAFSALAGERFDVTELPFSCVDNRSLSFQGSPATSKVVMDKDTGTLDPLPVTSTE